MLGETLVDPTTEDRYSAAEARAILGPALACLEPDERDLLRMRFADGRTQHDIGRHFGVSQTHVSRRLTAVLRRLRTLVDEPPLARVPAA